MKVRILGVAVLWFTACAAVSADELRVLGSQSMMLVWKEVGAEFERETGHRVILTTYIAATAKKMIDAGQQFDVVTLTPEVVDALIAEKKVLANSRVDIMRAPIGVAVRKGEPHPDISTVDAFKNALLTAKSVAYLKTGASGVYMAGLVRKLGIEEQLRNKTRLPDEDIVGPMVARGEADLGVTAVSVLLATPGLDIVGVIPIEIQNYVVFTGGISATTRSELAARAFLRYVTSGPVVKVIRAKGLEPVPTK